MPAGPPPEPPSASASDTDIIDFVDLSSDADRRAHSARWIRAEPSSAQATFGQIQEPIRGIALSPGGVVYVTMKTATPDRTAFAVRWATPPAHHGRAQSYSVEADGVELIAATDVDPGAGAARTAYAEFEPGAANVVLRIRAGWRNTFPMTLTGIRTYRQPADPGHGSPPPPEFSMGLALLTPKGSGFTISTDDMQAMAKLIPNSPYLTPQTAVLYNFCRKDLHEQMAAMRLYSDMAVRTRIPLRVLPQMHWAGLPSGVPDGAGGTFTDVPYQQITWDEADQVDDEGLKPLLGERYDRRYGLSVPNRWSNTPWLTFNHPRLNQYRRNRWQQAMTAWLTVRDRMARWGLAHLFPPELSTGEETVYWAKGVDDSAYTAVNGGKPRSALLADFNPFVVADALADRIILDPSNGLDRNERWWLHQNLSRWQQKIVDWTLEAVPPEPIRLAGGAPLYAEDLTRRNIYTEPYAMPVFPMRGVNPLRPGLEAGYVREGRSGGEYWSGAMMLPLLIKQRERGRIALPNLECTGADDGQLIACILAAYAHGARYSTLYNWFWRTNLDEILGKVAAAIEKGTTPLASNGRSSPRHAETSGQKPVGHEFTFTAGPDAFGVNRIAVSGRPSANAAVRVTIRTLDEKPARSASALAVPPPTGPETTPRDAQRTSLWVAHLPTMFHQKPGERYSVAVEPVRSSAAAAEDSSAGGGAPDDFTGVTLSSDLRLERWRSLAIGDWQDATDIIAALSGKDREPWSNPESRRRLRNAQDLMQQGRLRSAYRAAVRCEQLMFPCSFTVTEPGSVLGPFPIEVRCPEDRVRVTVRAMSDTLASLTLVGTVKQIVVVRYRGSAATLHLTPGVPATVEIETASGSSSGTRAR